MKLSRLAWTSLVVVGLGCSDGQGGPGTGSAGAGGAGRGGTTGAAGTVGAGGTAGTGGAGGVGGSNATGSAGAGGAGTGGGGGITTATGSAGTGGSAGAGGGGASGAGGGPAGNGGRGGTGGSAGSGGVGGTGVGGVGGTGGSGGSVGTGGRGGTGGVAGSGTGGSGGAGGSGGSGGSGGAGALHVTSTIALPNFQGSPHLVAVDSQDTLILVGPAAASDTEDPGPRVSWNPRQGQISVVTFANAITPAAIAVDPSRNLWLAGQLFRAVSFGGPTLQPVDNGYYLVRLGPGGSHDLSKAVTRTGSVWIRRVLADAQGNIYVVGGMYSTGSPLTQSAFVTKFTSDGVETYNREFPGQGTSAFANDVAVANGEVYIVGTFNAPLQIGTTTLTLPATSIDGGFVAALDADTGTPKRALRFGGPDFDVGNGIEVTSTGALRISGLISGAATVGGVNVQATAMGSAFVAELTAAGAGNWVKLLEGDGHVFAADTNGADHTFAVGYLQGATKQTFVADVVSDGSATLPLRVTTADDTNGGQCVAADRHGGAWVTGDFKGSINFGTGAISSGGASTFGDFLVHLEP